MKNKRNGSIDFWKFVFAVVIVIFHGKSFGVKEKAYFQGGYIGVEFFFIVSGFLMANSAERNRVANEALSLGKDTFLFMKKKIVGLMPNIYVAWVIGFIVEHIGEFSVKGMLEDAFCSMGELLFLTESGFKEYTANSVCWYISAMLIAMLLLYPLMRRYQDTFFYIIAPLLCIFLFGFTYHELQSISVPYKWVFGICYKSIIRAILDIGIGCICYKVSFALRDKKYTRFARCLWAVVELGGYGVTLVLSWNHGGERLDWYLTLFLSVAIICSFSQVGVLDEFFSRFRICNWLGEFSFSLFLGHGYWSHKMEILMPEAGYGKRMPVYIVLAFVTGLFIMYSSKWLKYLYGRVKEKHGKQIRSWFVVENG